MIKFITFLHPNIGWINDIIQKSIGRADVPAKLRFLASIIWRKSSSPNRHDRFKQCPHNCPYHISKKTVGSNRKYVIVCRFSQKASFIRQLLVLTLECSLRKLVKSSYSFNIRTTYSSMRYRDKENLMFQLIKKRIFCVVT